MSKWHPHTLGQLPYAVERLDGILLDEALGVCPDPGEGFCGCHVHLGCHLGGEQLDEALGGEHGFCGRLDKLLHMHSRQGLNVAPFCRLVNLWVDLVVKTSRSNFQMEM